MAKIPYSKTDNYVWNRPVIAWTDEGGKKEYTYVEASTGRRFKKVPIHAPGVRNGATGKPWREMLPQDCTPVFLARTAAPVSMWMAVPAGSTAMGSFIRLCVPIVETMSLSPPHRVHGQYEMGHKIATLLLSKLPLTFRV